MPDKQRANFMNGGENIYLMEKGPDRTFNNEPMKLSVGIFFD